MFLVIYYPIYSYVSIKRNFGNLQNRKVKEKYEVFYSGIRTNSMIRAQYNTWFLLRRVATVCLLVFVDIPFFQVSSLVAFSAINFIY